MKTLLTTLLITAICIVGETAAEGAAEKALSEAESRYYEAQAVIESKYRKDLATTLATADRIEVFLLDFEMEDTPSDFFYWENRLEEEEFPILPYGSKSSILKRAILGDEELKTFVPALQKVVGVQGDPGTGALCHFPIHGVRVFSGETMLFQSSFCWKCQNFALAYPDAPAWVGISGTKLFEVFTDVMPIPQIELDRFNAKYGSRTERQKHKAEQGGAGEPATRAESDLEDSDKPEAESEGRSR